MAMAWMRMEAGQPVAILHWVGVIEAHRGKRLGEALALACLHQHRRDGWPDCWLTTEDFRAAAIHLYERLGFGVACAVGGGAAAS
jgi:ribosomal protein S18 acetylase RimI-like enzyme